MTQEESVLRHAMGLKAGQYKAVVEHWGEEQEGLAKQQEQLLRSKEVRGEKRRRDIWFFFLSGEESQYEKDDIYLERRVRVRQGPRGTVRGLVSGITCFSSHRDEEYDKGRVKKVKDKKEWTSAQGAANP